MNPTLIEHRVEAVRAGTQGRPLGGQPSTAERRTKRLRSAPVIRRARHRVVAVRDEARWTAAGTEQPPARGLRRIGHHRSRDALPPLPPPLAPVQDNTDRCTAWPHSLGSMSGSRPDRRSPAKGFPRAHPKQQGLRTVASRCRPSTERALPPPDVPRETSEAGNRLDGLRCRVIASGAPLEPHQRPISQCWLHSTEQALLSRCSTHNNHADSRQDGPLCCLPVASTRFECYRRQISQEWRLCGSPAL
jgi:hypothetical protein